MSRLLKFILIILIIISFSLFISCFVFIFKSDDSNNKTLLFFVGSISLFISHLINEDIMLDEQIKQEDQDETF